MSRLHKHLVITNIAIMIVPLLITVIVASAYIFVSFTIFDTSISSESIKNLTNVEYELFKANSGTFQKNPEFLLDKDFQKNLTIRLSSINTDIVIIKNSKTVYSSKDFSQMAIERCLDFSKHNYLRSTVDLDGTPYIVKVINQTFPDTTVGYVILLAQIDKDVIASKDFIIFVIVMFFLTFIITNLILTYSFSKSMVKPILRLKDAASEISCGNLAHEVVVEGDSEIRDLCQSFEQMRLKLKESVYTQAKFEDNRKMLISSISHDLKTPITSIKGYVEGILDGVANSPEKIEKYLKTIYSKAVQVDSMIDDLLFHSKLDLNQMPFNFERTDVYNFFRHCIEEIEPELEKANIKIELINMLPDYRFLFIDRTQIRRVVLNILDNSKKYMNKENGTIEVTLREKDNNIIVQIKDNGAGIPKNDMPFIFDKFYRADTARSTKAGSGLGLAIAKQIIEGHQGKIWSISKENEGTSILFSLKKL
ncbi:sensor histidine kinase [Pseudobacteroides cellulosolvens]|uniref:histidine kinase n=1 Tax=Pseudobacteroides cellulosolvens ATCC 35603 = DSM 2933 TaxID=398512 RepID=A0A0L6JU77_9FIRM|nr:HAMP domain-containing sensor histidine kinase [Pseudobacteroides cellulosolvens]KNY29269.1 integral membrane sensor signal transduction histidine kinase [Pseudobacteroides cellulosolvens ATCC 35603 = DSM 2933]